MTTFNRACLAIYSSIWILACLGVITLAWNRTEKLDLSAGDLNIQAFIDTSDSVRLGFTALVASLALLGVATLVAALSNPKANERRPSEARMLQVRGEDGGVARVPMANIEALLRTELEAFPEIRMANARIRAHQGTVETDLDLTVAPDASVGYVEALATEVAISVLRDRIGVEAYSRPEVRCAFDTNAAKAANFGGEPRLGANQVIDYIDPEPLPKIQWEAPETRSQARPRPTWRQPADWEPAADE